MNIKKEEFIKRFEVEMKRIWKCIGVIDIPAYVYKKIGRNLKLIVKYG